MADLLAVPLKKPSDIDVTKPLKNLIASVYSTSDKPVDYTEEINEFSKLRNNALWKAFEKYESSLELIYCYYDQLCAMETKIPAHEIQIPFKWKDAFDRGSLFGGRLSLTIASLAYEKVCVLFNIAALQSCVAANQTMETDEGRKLAAKLLQQSAGIFNHLKSTVLSSIQQDPTPDLKAETLGALSALMLAQAQEIFVQKAIQDRMKDAVIAKLSSQCDELYTEAYKLMQKESLHPLWERGDYDWLSVVGGKQAAYKGLAQYYQSLVCNAGKSVGEEIARLQYALELFKTAQQVSGKATFFQDFVNKAQKALTESKKDNDFIYHERVPDSKSLAAVGKAPLAKAIPMTEKMSASSKDLFENLVPVPVLQAMAAYSVRKTDLVNTEIMKLREATQLLNSILASLNLPAALEDTTGAEIPHSMQEKAASVKSSGGLNDLQKMLQELPELLQRNQEILNECNRMVKEEEDSDTQLRNQFKEKWTRTPSAKLTDTFKANVVKYQTIITNAIEADKKVRAKFETHSEGIYLLDGDISALQAALPACGSSGASKSSAACQLRKLMENVEAIKAERDVIESELNSPTSDMHDKFLSALAQDGAINEANLSVEALGRTYGSLSKQVQESLQRQEALIAEIQRVNSEFCKEKSGAGAAAMQREEMLKKLAAAHDGFMELQVNLKEGSRFYNDLTNLLVNFQNKVSDFCFARKTEKDELLKDLTSDLSKVTAGTPSIPAHHESAPPTPSSAPAAHSAPLPYPVQPQGMPHPYAQQGVNPYAAYAPMPTGYNPYAYPQAPYPQQQHPASYSYPYPPPQTGYPQQSGFPSYPGYPPQPPPNQQQQPPW
ncbi:programmed cell death 6-interacting protein [Neocloeon triangulifer]|uniref:programmed cell death 6-interacting protein n=1 Tax=Neocloeon triangulifer TaxID=2078957 RepID=UPI00286F0A77|nr:programmed cell death 6-interacting protein [Neocloeon triangulifer]